MDDDPPVTWYEARDIIESSARRFHGRETRVAAFEIAIARFDDYFDAVEGPDSPGFEAVAMEPFVDPDVVREAREVVGADGVAVEHADSGRGASGYAAALELIGHVADVGGATAALYASAKAVKSVYERIRRRVEHRPLVSIGAAAYLAAADLADRVGPTFQLVGAHDAAQSPPDLSYTGEDQFATVFQRDLEMFLYLVEANGTVHFAGSVTRGLTPTEEGFLWRR